MADLDLLDDNTRPEVIVVGAGPVGLTTALALGRKGIKTLLLERSPKVGFLPKMDLTNARSMEIFGRLGVADRILKEGKWPKDANFDVHFGRSLASGPFFTLDYPSMNDMMADIEAASDGGQPRHPSIRMAQYNLEALLLDEVKKLPTVDVRYGHKFVELTQDETSVSAKIETPEKGEIEVSAQYLVGCDGGGSRVRRSLGIEYQGQAEIGRSYMIFFRCDDLLEKAGLKPFRHYHFVEGGRGVLVAQDDKKHWSVHTGIIPGTDPSTYDPVDILKSRFKLDLDVEIIYSGDWTPHMLVAERYSDGRVFLAGDSAHQYPPTGGFGMNTGVPDGENIAWKLAAVLQGWANPALLESYHAERHPVGQRNLEEGAKYAIMGTRTWNMAVKPDMFEDTPQARRTLRRFQTAANTLQRRNHEMHGIEFGYRYWQSPIVMPDFLAAPDPNQRYFMPTASVGTRIPHMWVKKGVSVHDELGPDMSLIAFNATDDEVAAFETLAGACSMPLKVLKFDGRDDIQKVYQTKFLLVRPDLHVAWRGDEAADLELVFNIITGAELAELGE